MKKGVDVTLHPSQVVIAAQVGVMRRILAMRRERDEPLGTPQADLWANDIESSAAELAASLVLGLPWNMVTQADLSTKPPDVGDDVEVRSTIHEAGHLPVYDRDRRDWRFVLAVGRIPTFRIVGVIQGESAMVDEYRRKTPRGTDAWWIPQDSEALTPIDRVS